MAPNLPSQTPVVIIGGGIIGLSTLYHLAARGVEAVLLERRKLASGTKDTTRVRTVALPVVLLAHHGCPPNARASADTLWQKFSTFSSQNS